MTDKNVEHLVSNYVNQIINLTVIHTKQWFRNYHHSYYRCFFFILKVNAL